MSHAHAPTPTRVGLIGAGTVGSALATALVTSSLAAMPTYALVRDPSRHRPTLPANVTCTSSIGDVLDNSDVVCEAMGGLEPARTYVLSALQRGISVVTANKQLMAAHGPELWAAADAGGCQLRYEAAVCGAIPIVRMVRESLAPSDIHTVVGIMNGTSNYVLTAMSEGGGQFADALADAQRLGYAEPDPSDDVSGADAAAKLVLLAGAAFHSTFAIGDIATRGIGDLESVDIRMARGLGYVIKSLGRARLAGPDAVTLSTGPMLVPQSHGLAAVGGATNAVLVGGDPCGELIVQGAGAGGPETASAMLGDVAGILAGTSRLAGNPDNRALRITPSDELPEPQYARLRVPDRPGILADVAGRLADADVSIARVVQERERDGSALLVLTTHPAARQSIVAALDAGPTIDQPVILPMLETTGE